MPQHITANITSWKSGVKEATRLLLISLSTALLFCLLVKLLPTHYEQIIKSDLRWIVKLSLFEFFVMGVLLAGFIETLCQSVPAYILGNSPSRGRRTAYVLISTVVFVALHNIYSPVYILIIIPGSLILSCTYLYYWSKQWYPYLMTAIVHGMNNLILYLLLKIGTTGVI
jgi:membrane protease YdiL (CAAX protease family)